MLEDLQIKDFALINSVSLEFNSGFTVLSGETGAGKSILIGALSFLLGGKCSIDQIRTGSHEAKVSGTIFISNKNTDAIQWLNEHSIELENNRVLLRRIIRDTGKTGAWIQDTPVTRTELAEFTSCLVDIHGQHEHQSLMYPAKHGGFLDSFAGIEAEVKDFTKLYVDLVEKRKFLEELNSSDAEISRKIEMLSFAVEEISDAKLKKSEDEQLEAEETRLSQYEKLYGNIDNASEILTGDNGNIVAVLKKARQSLQYSSQVDKSLEPLYSRIDSAFYELSDISDELKSYKNSLIFDPGRLSEVQERLGLIFNLKKKYATSVQSSLDEVIEYGEKAQIQLEKLSSNSQHKDELEAEIAVFEKKVFEMAKNISGKRQNAANKMALEVEKVLSELGMKNTKFAVSITQKPGDTVIQRCGPYGIDNIEFLISANPGSPLKPLAKIASGGELSRVMLSLKTVLSSSVTIDTLIFDEIDTGIGGEVAVAVGHHIQNLAKKVQILCITHLASIAVCADTQIKIEKSVESGITATHVREISGEKRVEEIARMLSGDAVSEASLEHARSLLNLN